MCIRDRQLTAWWSFPLNWWSPTMLVLLYKKIICLSWVQYRWSRRCNIWDCSPASASSGNIAYYESCCIRSDSSRMASPQLLSEASVAVWCSELTVAHFLSHGRHYNMSRKRALPNILSAAMVRSGSLSTLSVAACLAWSKHPVVIKLTTVISCRHY